MKDSGERETYASGMIRQPYGPGYPRFDLMWPEDVPFDEQYLTRIAVQMGRGALKYRERNWECGYDEAAYRRARASAHSHFAKWFNGVEDGDDHAAALFFNVMQVLYHETMLRSGPQHAAPQQPGDLVYGDPCSICDADGWPAGSAGNARYIHENGHKRNGPVHHQGST